MNLSKRIEMRLNVGFARIFYSFVQFLSFVFDCSPPSLNHNIHTLYHSSICIFTCVMLSFFILVNIIGQFVFNIVLYQFYSFLLLYCRLIGWFVVIYNYYLPSIHKFDRYKCMFPACFFCFCFFYFYSDPFYGRGCIFFLLFFAKMDGK